MENIQRRENPVSAAETSVNIAQTWTIGAYKYS